MKIDWKALCHCNSRARIPSGRRYYGHEACRACGNLIGAGAAAELARQDMLSRTKADFLRGRKRALGGLHIDNGSAA